MTAPGAVALTRLALRRMRARPVAVAVVALAVGAGAALMGWSSIAAARSQENNVRLRLRELPPDERAIQVVYHVRIGEPDTRRAAVDALFRELRPVTTAPRRVTVLQSVEPDKIALVTAADPGRDVHVVGGRLPARCMGRICEALALGGDFRLGQTVDLGYRVTARIVGRGAVARDALPVGSEALPRTPAVRDRALLVPSLGPPLAVFAMKETGTTVVTTAALAPDEVEASQLRALRERIRVAFVRLERTGELIEETGPIALLDGLAERGEVAQERLLLVAGQAAALLVAFAAFAAAARRRDTELLDEQLTTLGASRAEIWLVRTAETALPAVAGAGAATAALHLAVRPLPGETLLAIALVTLAAVFLLLFASSGPRRRSRFRLGALELAAAAALAVIAWQAAARGGLSADTISAGDRRDPVLLLLPALTFFTCGVLLLRAVPPLLRLAERLARHASVALRLGFLTAARNPAEAAAVTTFLAVSLGVAAFGLNYRATLDRQSLDEARFAAGAAWRVVERPQERTPAESAQAAPSDRPEQLVSGEGRLGSGDVTPLSRFAAASAERPSPVLRLAGDVQEADVAGRTLEAEILGVPMQRLGRIGGWRDGFSTLDRSEIAARLRPRPLRLAGPRLADGVRAIRFWARSDAQLRRFVIAHFLEPREQRFAYARGGTLTSDWQPLTLRVPRGLRGAELVALEFPSLEEPQSAPPDEGSVQFGRFEQRVGDAWVPLAAPRGWAAGELGGSTRQLEYAAGPVRELTALNIEGSPLTLVHYDVGIPEAPPALVSRSVAATAVDGRVTLSIAGVDLPLRVAAQARYFPSVVAHPKEFVVLDYDMLFAALNAGRPGVAPPSEAWFFAPQRAGFAERLERPPFRVEEVVGAAPAARRLAADPLAAGARDVLALAAVAAAILAVLGLVLAVRSTLDAERPALAEYEALGVAPATLRRSLQLRLASLALLGVAAGLVGGLLATRLVATLVAVTGNATRPLPPIEPAVAWPADAVVVGGTAIAALAAAALLARLALRESAARRLRA